MKFETIIYLMFLFLIYSFIGWVLEVLTIAIKEHRFVNRGITNGPLCPIYGFTSLTLLLATKDINSLFWIFIASIVYGTLIEFITGKVLEKFNKSKWWDYSNKKYNLDGYICLEYSLFWGFLGCVLVYLINPLMTLIFNGVYLYITAPIILVLMVIVLIDLLTSFISLKHVSTTSLNKISSKIGNYILSKVQYRIKKAYPSIKNSKVKTLPSNVFAEGASFYKLFVVFLIGGFLGNISEIFWCRYAMGYWMNRSSLVFLPISIVWGLAFSIATLLLHKYKNKSNTFLFIFGSIIGGSYEYICSVFTEFFFGTIFWDYSKIPFNLNGRINLLFCFFWGFAAVIYIKLIYPRLERMIEAIPKKIGNIVTTFILFFFIVDLIITGCVMLRFHNRSNGEEAINFVEKLCDEYADDEYMKKHWSNMKNVKDLKN